MRVRYHCPNADQRARSVAERIERMHSWLQNKADGRKFGVWVEKNGRIVWAWERSYEQNAVYAGTFTNKVGLKDFKDAIYCAYDSRRAA